MDNSSLTHHGTKGMRWGFRRYQNKDGSLTPEGKKRYGQPEVDKEAYEKNKQQAIKSGSAKDVLKYKGDLTQQEMRTAIERIRWEQDMQSIASKEVSAGKAKADKFFNSVETITGYADKAAKAWNMAANVYNAIGTDHKMLPKIDTNITSGNRKERKAEAKERQKEVDAKKKREEQEAQRDSKHEERAQKRAKQEAEKEPKVTVETPNKKSEKNTKKQKETIYDAEWREVDDPKTSEKGMQVYNRVVKDDPIISDFDTNTDRLLLEQRVAGFLESPKKKRR